MKNTWYISFFIAILVVLGISVAPNSAPNQELHIQFADSQISSAQTDVAIAQVKGTLEAIGVTSVKIQRQENGTLKIAYYSDIDVADIKKAFSKELAFENASEAPENGKNSDYELAVYKIQKSQDLIDFEGNVVESKSETTRFYTPDVYASVVTQNTEQKNTLTKLTYTVQRNIALATDNTSYKIPEVRAGPLHNV